MRFRDEIMGDYTGQTRAQTLVETIVSVGSGFIIAWTLTYYILPLWGFHPTVKDAGLITLVYTGASLIRTFVVRRVFNGL